VIGMAVGVAGLGQSPVAGFALIGVVAAVVVVGFDYFTVKVVPTSGIPRWAVIALATLLALPLFTVVLAVALVLSIVVAFAQRGIAVENVDPVACHRSGWRLMRTHVGDRLMAWLINVSLAW